MIGKLCYEFCENNQLWKVENFEVAAISDDVWHLHHKMGAYCGRSTEYLKEHGLYYNRPPEELIFLRPSEHRRIHSLCAKNPVIRENLRRKTMQDLYSRGLPNEPWLLDSDECRRLNLEIEKFVDDNNSSRSQVIGCTADDL